MRLYLTTGEDADGAKVGKWAGSQADAGKARKALKKDKFGDVDTEEVEVPTTKADLIEFLNKHTAGMDETHGPSHSIEG